MNDERHLNATTGDGPVLLVVFGTPVKAEPGVLVNLMGLWGGATMLAGRRKPERSWPALLAVGAASAASWAAADFGHALANIASAQAAGAPMDEVRISQGMPRTIYADHDVPPAGVSMGAVALGLVGAGAVAIAAALNKLR